MLHVSFIGWAVATGGVLGLFVIDFLLAYRNPNPVGLHSALVWAGFYLCVAIGVGVVLAVASGTQVAEQFFAGYLLERSLSFDNLLVFLLIFTRFGVPAAVQRQGLMMGITAALALRIPFVVFGAVLVNAFSVTFLIFGVVLLVAAYGLLRQGDDSSASPGSNRVVLFAERHLAHTARYDGRRLVTSEGDRRVLTPLVLVALAIGTTDLIFAADSIPAVFGVTQSVYLVGLVNALALLGLRPLYFLVAQLLDRLVFLSPALAGVLAFIAIKLILHFAHGQDSAFPEISTALSLAVVGAALCGAVCAQALTRRRPGRPDDSRGG
jgi:tellurite resistance protein TerC